MVKFFGKHKLFINDFSYEPGEPIIFTKDGIEVGTLVDAEEWKRTQSEIRLLKELLGEENNSNGIPLDEFRKRHTHKKW